MNRNVWLVMGILSIVGGVIAFFNPFSATIAAEQLIGWIFLLVSLVILAAALRFPLLGEKVFAVVLGILGVLFAIELISKPLNGVLTLTLVIAGLFLVTGITKIVASFFFRATVMFMPLFLSGLVSVIFAAMVFADFPQSAAIMLGILLAIELISNGITMFFFARHRY